MMDLRTAWWPEAMKQTVPETEQGQGMVEYGLILAPVAVVAVAALVLMGPQIVSILSSVNASL